MGDISALRRAARLPVIGAPMFLVSGVDLVVAQCAAGVIGTFPALNARPEAELDHWLTRIEAGLAEWHVEPGLPPVPRSGSGQAGAGPALLQGLGFLALVTAGAIGLALLGIGIRRLSSTPAGVGPIKELIRKVDLDEITQAMNQWLAAPPPSLREALAEWARDRGIEAD